MPNYQRWSSYAQQRLPPTPPDFQSTMYLTPTSAMSDDMHNFYPSQSYPSRHPSSSSRDYSDRFHGTSFASQPSMPMHSHGRSKHFRGNHDFHRGYSHQVMPPQYYGPVAAPILPPIQAPEDAVQYNSHFGHAHPEPKPKEEKPTGGVAQHLDYEMDLMSSFVAEMSQRLVSHGSSPTPQFRKYVSQILSSTRLPSSTIMLGLFYLQERMKILSQRQQEASSSGTVYRMLTTCLLLGSKFLDDNTFQNRSWAEVSSIPVSELNMMELDWLEDFNWEIHGLMYDKEEGFFMWIDHWHAYEEKAQIAKVKERQTLAPIETNFPRNQVPPRPLMSPDGPIPAQYQHDPQYDTQWVRPYMSGYSPPSAPDSGPTTPEYYASQWSYPQAPQSYARASWGAGNGHNFNSQRAQMVPYPAQFPTSFGHPAWAGHGVGCGCTLCAKHSEYYFNHGGYGLQSVVG